MKIHKFKRDTLDKVNPWRAQNHSAPRIRKHVRFSGYPSHTLGSSTSEYMTDSDQDLMESGEGPGHISGRPHRYHMRLRRLKEADGSKRKLRTQSMTEEPREKEELIFNPLTTPFQTLNTPC